MKDNQLKALTVMQQCSTGVLFSRGQVVEDMGLYWILPENLSEKSNTEVTVGLREVAFHQRKRQSIEGSYSDAAMQHWCFVSKGQVVEDMGLYWILPENLSEKLSTEVTVGLTGGSHFFQKVYCMWCTGVLFSKGQVVEDTGLYWILPENLSEKANICFQRDK